MCIFKGSKKIPERQKFVSNFHFHTNKTDMNLIKKNMLIVCTIIYINNLSLCSH